MQLLQLAGLGFIILKPRTQVLNIRVRSPTHVLGHGRIEKVQLVLVLDRGEVGSCGAERAHHAGGGEGADA